MSRILLLFVAYVTALNGFANVVQDFCSGPTSLLNITNRPTNADSPCVIPFKKLFIQSGWQYQELYTASGTLQYIGNTVLRIGLPAKNEFIVLMPDYVHQSRLPQGTTATTLGMKHQLGDNNKWIIAGEGYVTLPSGSAAFGNAGTGVTINGIINYSLNNSPYAPSLARQQKLSTLCI